MKMLGTIKRLAKGTVVACVPVVIVFGQVSKYTVLTAIPPVSLFLTVSPAGYFSWANFFIFLNEINNRFRKGGISMKQVLRVVVACIIAFSMGAIVCALLMWILNGSLIATSVAQWETIVSISYAAMVISGIVAMKIMLWLDDDYD